MVSPHQDVGQSAPPGAQEPRAFPICVEEPMTAPPELLIPPRDPAAAIEVVAATQVWLKRAVIGLNLCPFAKAVHIKRQIRHAVTGARTHDELLAELEHELLILAEANPEVLETTLLIHPEVMGNFLDFHFFLAEADAAIRRLELAGVIQIASLHPRYEFAGSDADDIDNYSNRSPYPTLHLLREASIDRAVVAFPDAADIFERNIETLRKLGHEGWRRLWLDDTPKG